MFIGARVPVAGLVLLDNSQVAPVVEYPFSGAVKRVCTCHMLRPVHKDERNFEIDTVDKSTQSLTENTRRAHEIEEVTTLAGSIYVFLREIRTRDLPLIKCDVEHSPKESGY